MDSTRPLDQDGNRETCNVEVHRACHLWSVHVSTLHTRSDFAHLSAARFPERVGSHTTASRREKRMAAPTEAALDSIRAVMRSGSIR